MQYAKILKLIINSIDDISFKTWIPVDVINKIKDWTYIPTGSIANKLDWYIEDLIVDLKDYSSK